MNEFYMYIWMGLTDVYACVTITPLKIYISIIPEFFPMLFIVSHYSSRPRQLLICFVTPEIGFASFTVSLK